MDDDARRLLDALQAALDASRRDTPPDAGEAEQWATVYDQDTHRPRWYPSPLYDAFQAVRFMPAGIDEQARAALAAVGLFHRIDEEAAARIDADTWREIFRLALLVIECVTYAEPQADGRWLRIDALHTTPNAGGYCTTRPAVPVYWLSKLDFLRLHELENFLTDLAR